MSKLFQLLLGVNWQTTMAGIVVIVGLAGKIFVAVKNRDFTSVFTDGKELMTDITALAIGLGLLKAKDAHVTGAGDDATRVHTN